MNLENNNTQKWAEAKIQKQVRTGIKIQWMDGVATQLIAAADVNKLIRKKT